MMAAQWVASTPNDCNEDEVPLHFSVNRKSPRGSWIALALLIESCATIKVWGFFFSVGDNLGLVLGLVLLTIALSRQGAEQLAGREDPGLGKQGSESLNPGVSF